MFSKFELYKVAHVILPNTFAMAAEAYALVVVMAVVVVTVVSVVVDVVATVVVVAAAVTEVVVVTAVAVLELIRCVRGVYKASCEVFTGHCTSSSSLNL